MGVGVGGSRGVGIFSTIHRFSEGVSNIHNQCGDDGLDFDQDEELLTEKKSHQHHSRSQLLDHLLKLLRKLF